MLAASAEHAWKTPAAIGRRVFEPRDAEPYAECRSCANAPHTVAKTAQRVKAAKKRAR